MADVCDWENALLPALDLVEKWELHLFDKRPAAEHVSAVTRNPILVRAARLSDFADDPGDELYRRMLAAILHDWLTLGQIEYLVGRLVA